VLHKSITYIYKVFKHIDKLWMGYIAPPLAWYPHWPLSLRSIYRNFRVGADLSDVVPSWLSLKPHLECFTNPYHIYIKCFCTLISCEWVYGTSLSLIPPLSLGSMYRNFGVGTDLSDVVTSWLSLKPHLECFTNPYHIYIKCFRTLISCEWVHGTSISLIPPLSLGSILRNIGLGTDLSDVVPSWLSLKPHLECFTNPYHIYI
jgi:uncharacterized integral membrane protein